MSRRLFHFYSFIILSILIHLGIILYFSVLTKGSSTSPLKPSPFFVTLGESPPKPREFDVPPPKKPTERNLPGQRLAESDQVIKREEAPKGEDLRDNTPLSLLPDKSAPKESGKIEPPVQPVTKGLIPSFSKENLYLSTQSAAKKVANLDPEILRKARRDVEDGQVVLLDTEKDILGSFYKRFRNSVEDVWDYPKDAIARGEAGVCLYRIEINRAGVLLTEPELLKTSGSERLDNEASRAVIAASPRFGFLPDAYREETLVIFAYFDYRLGSRPNVSGAYYYR